MKNQLFWYDGHGFFSYEITVTKTLSMISFFKKHFKRLLSDYVFKAGEGQEELNQRTHLVDQLHFHLRSVYTDHVKSTLSNSKDEAWNNDLGIRVQWDLDKWAYGDKGLTGTNLLGIVLIPEE